MRVLHIISSSGMYGAESVVLNLSRCLNANGDEGVIAVFSHSDDKTPQLYEAAKSKGVRAHLIPCRGQLDRTVPQRIRDVVASEEIDVLHAHGYKADVYARLAGLGTPVPLISTCHTWHDVGFRDRLYGRIDRYILRAFDAIVAVSAEVEQRLIKSGVTKTKVHRIQNGIDTDLFDGASVGRSTQDRPLTVGLAGRLAHEKAPDLFVQMASKVLKKMPDVRFVIAGDGEQRSALEHLIADLKIGDQVSLLGRVEDMAEFYASLDVLVSCSRSEGFPIGLLEAMASSTPIVATTVGDVPHIVKDGETGLLIAPENIEALLTATLRLLSDSTLREDFGRNARRVAVEKFSAVRMMLENRKIYANLLDARMPEAAIS